MSDASLKRKTSWLEIVFICFSTLYLLYTFRGVVRDLSGSSFFLVNSSIVIIIYTVTCYLIVIRKPRCSMSFSFILFATLVVISSLSLFWSVSRSDTFNGLIGLYGVAIFGFYIGTVLRSDFVKYFLNIVLIYLAVTLLLYVLGFEVMIYRRGYGPPAFQGFSDHKNLIGNMVGLAAIMLYAEARSGRFKLVLAALYFSLFLLTFVFARASTSLVAFSIAVFIYEIAFLFSKRRVSTLGFATITIYMFALVLILIPPIWLKLLSFMGENETLSSRTIIWDIVTSQIEDRPFFGFGFNAFWTEGNPQLNEFAKRFYGTTFKQSHNGFIEIAANIGILSLFIMIAACTITIFHGHRCIGKADYRRAFWAGSIFIIFNNFGEANFFIGNYLMFSVLFATSLILPVTKRSTISNM